MAKLANNRNIWDNVRDRFPHPYGEKEAKEFIDIQSKNDLEQVCAIDYIGQFCGCIGMIFQEDVYRKSAEIGYWIGEPFWNKGVATAALRLLVHKAFNEMKLKRLFAGVYQYNIGSIHVLEKNGFALAGILKKAVFKNDKFWDEHRFALINGK